MEVVSDEKVNGFSINVDVVCLGAGFFLFRACNLASKFGIITN